MTRPLLALAAVRLLLPLGNAEPFGYFRDELYYLVCGLRPDWGYVDHPPLAPLLAAAGWKLFGETLYGLRFFPALFGAAAVLVSGLLARRLGAGPFGQTLSALAVLLAPHYLVVGSMLTTDSFLVFFWAALAFVTVRLVQEQQPRLWLWFGVLAGLGLQAKHSTVFYGFALLVGLVVAGEWRLLLNRWLPAGGATALLVFLPNLLWQAHRGWPTYELLSNVKASTKNVVLGPLEYVAQQFVLLGPLASPLWIVGLMCLLRARDRRGHRALGVAYLVTLALMIALKGKNYYLAPAYPVLFAAGAAAFERWTTRSPWRWARPAYVTVLVASIAILLPIGVPLLSPERTAAYQRRIGFQAPRTERSHTAELPQHLADRLGWEAMVESVTKVYWALPAEERERAGIFAQNYGEAAAIDILGRTRGLPPALSGHQSYFLWGPRGHRGEVLIVLDDTPGTLPELCGSLQDRGPVSSHPHAMPFEKNQRIYVCRDMKPPLPQLWPRVKRWL